jgi:2-keto-3-deoxy-L-rhamnonate aldolase RhmA
MQLSANPLKRALRERQRQIGLWCMLSSPVAAEVVAGSGFDFAVVDMEHAPNEIPAVHAQLQAMETGTAEPVVRPPWNDPVAFKRLLDVGVRSFVVPFVQTAEEARRAVASTRYPPHGIRGVALATRANRYGRVNDYLRLANEEICVHVQLETRLALANLEEIASVEGVDGLFIGPSDLAADLGHLGDSAHPDVRRAIDDAISRIRRTGKAAGILAPLEADARAWLDLGATFVAVGSDLGLLARQSEALVKKFKP